ncbi:MAG: hypothetical protein IT439_05925 [Phycisphaerales bacterium]|nr:hypothetical protein [Phycisphaerales bacterium]
MRIRAAALLPLCACLLGACNAQRPMASYDAEGRRQIAAGDLNGAETTYRKYVDRRPQSAQGHFGLGRALSAQGRHLAASQEFKLATQIDGANEEYFEAYCQSLLSAERHDELLTVLRRRANGSRDGRDYQRLARFAEESGTAEEALDALLTWARIDRGRSVEPQLALANFYRRVGDGEKESMRLRAILYIDPANREATDRLRDRGEITGESLAIQPPEQIQ